MLYKLLNITSDHWSEITIKNVITGKIIKFKCNNTNADRFMHAACRKGIKFLSVLTLEEEYNESMPEYPEMNTKGMPIEEYLKTKDYKKYCKIREQYEKDQEVWEQEMVKKYQKDNIIIVNEYGLGEPITQPDCYIRKLNIFQVLWYRFGIFKWIKD